MQPRRDMQDTPRIRTRLVGVNVPPAERILSGFFGGLAIGIGLRERSLGGFALIGLGTFAMVRAVAGRCPLYRTRAARKGVQVRRAITIQATPQQVYDLWRNPTNLPKFMHHVKAVSLEDSGISHWSISLGHKELEWRAKVVEDTPPRRLRWKSLPGGDIEHEGSLVLREAPGDRGTIVEVKMRYFPPGGLFVASALYGFLRNFTEVQIGQELARLQQLLETGEITTGARRVADLDEDRDKAIAAAHMTAVQPQPVTTAGTSGWTTGGGR